jgi:hypothetical protein
MLPRARAAQLALVVHGEAAALGRLATQQAREGGAAAGAPGPCERTLGVDRV